MSESLEFKAARDPLSKTLNSAARGAQHIGAFALALGAGTICWLMYDPQSVEDLLRKPTLREEVMGIYRASGLFTPAPEVQAQASARILDFYKPQK